MNRLIRHLVVLLLIPALAVDPGIVMGAVGAGFHPRPQSDVLSIRRNQISGRRGGLPLQSPFTSQALSPAPPVAFETGPVSEGIDRDLGAAHGLPAAPAAVPSPDAARAMLAKIRRRLETETGSRESPGADLRVVNLVKPKARISRIRTLIDPDIGKVYACPTGHLLMARVPAGRKIAVVSIRHGTCIPVLIRAIDSEGRAWIGHAHLYGSYFVTKDIRTVSEQLRVAAVDLKAYGFSRIQIRIRDRARRSGYMSLEAGLAIWMVSQNVSVLPEDPYTTLAPLDTLNTGDWSTITESPPNIGAMNTKIWPESPAAPAPPTDIPGFDPGLGSIRRKHRPEPFDPENRSNLPTAPDSVPENDSWFARAADRLLKLPDLRGDVAMARETIATIRAVLGDDDARFYFDFWLNANQPKEAFDKYSASPKTFQEDVIRILPLLEKLISESGLGRLSHSGAHQVTTSLAVINNVVESKTRVDALRGHKRVLRKLNARIFELSTSAAPPAAPAAGPAAPAVAHRNLWAGLEPFRIVFGRIMRETPPGRLIAVHTKRSRSREEKAFDAYFEAMPDEDLENLFQKIDLFIGGNRQGVRPKSLHELLRDEAWLGQALRHLANALYGTNHMLRTELSAVDRLEYEKLRCLYREQRAYLRSVFLRWINRLSPAPPAGGMDDSGPTITNDPSPADPPAAPDAQNLVFELGPIRKRNRAGTIRGADTEFEFEINPVKRNRPAPAQPSGSLDFTLRYSLKSPVNVQTQASTLHFPDEPISSYVTSEGIGVKIRRSLDEVIPNTVHLTALSGNVSIGSALLYLNRPGAIWLGWIGVEYKESGHGEQLMRAILEVARRDGRTTINCDVAQSNVAARRFFSEMSARLGLGMTILGHDDVFDHLELKVPAAPAAGGVDDSGPKIVGGSPDALKAVFDGAAPPPVRKAARDYFSSLTDPAYRGLHMEDGIDDPSGLPAAPSASDSVLAGHYVNKLIVMDTHTGHMTGLSYVAADQLDVKERLAAIQSLERWTRPIYVGAIRDLLSDLREVFYNSPAPLRTYHEESSRAFHLAIDLYPFFLPVSKKLIPVMPQPFRFCF
jgi:hypothetical protein